MGRLRRLALWFGAAGVAALSIALLVVNLYVQSQGTQAWIQQELSRRAGTSISIHGISVTPWGGLTLSGIAIPQVSNATTADFLQADSFHLHVRIFPLFSHRLIIKEISLLSPNVVWPQTADGKWRLPGARAGEAPVTTTPSTEPQPSRPETAGQPSPAEPSTVVATPAPTASARTAKTEPRTNEAMFVPELRRMNITGGNFRFLDRTGSPVASFDDVRFHSSVRNNQTIRGDVSVAKIALHDRFFLQSFQSPLRYDPAELNLSKISARAGSGDVSGEFTVQTQAADSPFSVSVKFRDVQAEQIITEAGGPKGVVQGKLEGSFEATGKPAVKGALSGHGELFLRNGQVQQYSLLVALGQILQIEELTQLQLQQAEVKYHIDPGVVTIDELILRSPNIRLSATGTMHFNGKLRLESELAINEKIRAQLFSPIRDNFQPTSEPGYSSVTFQVGGSIDKPRTNLMDKLVGRNLKDFVNGLFGGGKSERPKRKQSPEQAPETSPGGPPILSPNQSAPPAPASTPP